MTRAPEDEDEPTYASRARAAYSRREWEQGWSWFSRADAAGSLGLDDLEAMRWCAGLTGRDDEMISLNERIYQRSLEEGDPERAASAAFWNAMRLNALGEAGRASAWSSRAQQLVADRDCAMRGWLLIMAVHRHLRAGQLGDAAAAAAEAQRAGRRFADRDLVAIATNLLGRVRCHEGRVADGLACLDEAMLSVTTGEVSPLVTGLVYCNVIAGCQLVFALDRSREWTAALAAWCGAQPELVTFNGTCRVHRSEVMQLSGDWDGALEEATRVAGGRSPDALAVGGAHYQRGEILRLRGQWAEAEEAYRLASVEGREPQPGLALLRASQGQVDAACASLRRLHGSTSTPLLRAALLTACVQVLVVSGDLEGAKVAAAELAQLAERFSSALLGAVADHAQGEVALAEGDLSGALTALRRAFEGWSTLGAPYPLARIRASLARAYQALGDHDAASLEREAARAVFTALGAIPDLSGLDAPGKATGDRHGLSEREVEVLLLVAQGKTNRMIARQLHLSEKTVDRHVSNIFTKIDVPSRAAATAFAYQRGLVGRHG
jgi:DNA-binding NarL/FixJ family response regulator